MVLQIDNVLSLNLDARPSPHRGEFAIDPEEASSSEDGTLVCTRVSRGRVVVIGPNPTGPDVDTPSGGGEVPESARSRTDRPGRSAGTREALRAIPNTKRPARTRQKNRRRQQATGMEESDDEPRKRQRRRRRTEDSILVRAFSVGL